MNSIVKYLQEVRVELTKVTWPKRDEVIKLTLIVLVISALVGIYVGGLDLMFTKILETLIAS